MRVAVFLVFLFMFVVSVDAVVQDNIGTSSSGLTENIHATAPDSPTPDCRSAAVPPYNPLVAESSKWYSLYLFSKSSRTPIWAAVRYKVRGAWRGQGWWRLDAGAPAVWVAVTDTPYFVVYASDGKGITWGYPPEDQRCTPDTTFNIRGPASSIAACNVCGIMKYVTPAGPGDSYYYFTS
jgi:uncharacterized membrane protein